jgi:hypothetical protein
MNKGAVQTGLAGVLRRLLARQPQGLEALAIFVKRLLRGLVLAHLSCPDNLWNVKKFPRVRSRRAWAGAVVIDP